MPRYHVFVLHDLGGTDSLVGCINQSAMKTFGRRGKVKMMPLKMRFPLSGFSGIHINKSLFTRECFIRFRLPGQVVPLYPL